MTTDTKPLPTIGVDRLVIAPILTEPEDSNPTYGTPIAMPGLVELTDTPGDAISNFYADDGIYVQAAQPGAPVAPVTIAGIDLELYASIFGHTYDSATGTVVEVQQDVKKEYALGYRAQLPNGKYEYRWYMVGIFTKSDKTFGTKAETIAYNTQPIQFNARPVAYASSQSSVLMRRFSTDDPNAPTGLTDDALKSITTGWFSDPNYSPTAPGTAVADFAITTGAAGQLDATWSAPTGATSQKIQVLDPVSGKYYDATLTAALSATGNSATITGLTSGNTYTARLVVVSGTNNGISNTDTAAAG